MTSDTIQQKAATSGQVLDQNKPTVPSENFRSAFRSLSPIDNADQMGNYCDALSWALENREANDIKNIALTGPYGSGKSSILRTFVNKAKKSHRDLYFLNISLATFKEEINDGVEQKQRTDNAQTNEAGEAILLRQIEYSILQQIFYHVNHEDIPHTRFRKQRTLTEETARKWTNGIFLFLASLLFEVYHKQLWELIGFTPYRPLHIYYHGIALLFLAICSYNFIRLTINSLHTVRLRKFNIKNAEFAVDNNFEKSILNEHLDEILYFFEATKFNVVIIEDLDRFNKTEIFTKLREINQLINNKTNRKTLVTFIYAVRDDMFMDRNRTKFFDFIIPVIPVVGPTNSNEILRRLISENEYNIDTDLIDGIAAYVDDMRLIFNIMNEFHIYRQTLNDKLNLNKLLAIILYKNTYPQDFVALSKREGLLFKAIGQKDTILQAETVVFDERIKNLKERKSELLSSTIRNLSDLKKLYLLEVLTSVKDITEFEHRGTSISFNDVLEDNNWLLLVTGQIKAVVRIEDEIYESINIDFSEIEIGVDSKETFSDKLDALRHMEKMKLTEIEQRIREVEEERSALRGNSIRTLMEANLIELKNMEHKQEQLVSILLRSGYIDEYFENYTSIFYPESISRSDADFLLNVQAKLPTDFDYQLTHVEALVEKLKDVEFDREFILNYNLVDYLLQNKSSVKIRTKVFTMLGNQSSKSLQFINSYIKRGKKVDKFIAALVQHWENMWNYYQGAQWGHDYDFPEDFRELIIRHGKVSDLVKMGSSTNLRSYIANRPDILTLSVRGNKMQDIIRELGIKFSDIEMATAPSHLLHFVFSWNFYEINDTMIRKWYLLLDGSQSSAFDNGNYSILKDSMELDPMLDYIDENLGTYLENVWLKLRDEQVEDEIYFEELLISDKISTELKLKVIDKCRSKVPDVSIFEDLNIVRELLRQGKVSPDWMNLLQYYKNNGQNFDRFIIGFLNMEDNAYELQHETLDGKKEIDHSIVHRFAEAMILCNDIDDKYYGDLIQSISWNYNSGLDFRRLTERKAQALIQKLETTPENYEAMKRWFPNLRIELMEADIDRFMEELGQYSLDGRDIGEIIRSEHFTGKQKSEVISSVNELIVLNDIILLREIARQCSMDKDITLSNLIAISIVRDQEIEIEYRIALSYLLFENLEPYEIKKILDRWEEPYSQLGKSFDELSFKPSEIDLKFIKSLVSRRVIADVKATKNTIKIVSGYN